MNSFVRMLAAIVVVTNITSLCHAQNVDVPPKVFAETTIVTWGDLPDDSHRLFTVEIMSRSKDADGNITLVGKLFVIQFPEDGGEAKTLFRDAPVFGVTNGKKCRFVSITPTQVSVFSGDLKLHQRHVLLRNAVEEKDAQDKLRDAFDEAIKEPASE